MLYRIVLLLWSMKSVTSPTYDLIYPSSIQWCSGDFICHGMIADHIIDKTIGMLRNESF